MLFRSNLRARAAERFADLERASNQLVDGQEEESVSRDRSGQALEAVDVCERANASPTRIRLIGLRGFEFDLLLACHRLHSNYSFRSKQREHEFKSDRSFPGQNRPSQNHSKRDRTACNDTRVDGISLDSQRVEACKQDSKLKLA